MSLMEFWLNEPKKMDENATKEWKMTLAVGELMEFILGPVSLGTVYRKRQRQRCTYRSDIALIENNGVTLDRVWNPFSSNFIIIARKLM